MCALPSDRDRILTQPPCCMMILQVLIKNQTNHLQLKGLLTASVHCPLCGLLWPGYIPQLPCCLHSQAAPQAAGMSCPGASPSCQPIPLLPSGKKCRVRFPPGQASTQTGERSCGCCGLPESGRKHPSPAGHCPSKGTAAGLLHWTWHQTPRGGDMAK